MKRIALLQPDGLVINVIAADDAMTNAEITAMVESAHPGLTWADVTTVVCSPGDTYISGSVTPAAASNAAPYDPRIWWIDIGPFFDRFGAAKYAILASADPMVQAIIKDVTVRQFIDLKRAEVGVGLDILLAKGFAIDKTAILTTATTELERHIKKLREVWA